ncbi:dynein axonemal heavy chain 1-like [Coccinella septempunctata]|uniref:dynein axonemal heavy chain 1-like n=1 Tax=Coccinella septempunctata TaxID=41139 RepID=UPI001D069CA8|nr:dynein axonemal heavy chain 1-like [Coccinella septempunctata]
MTNLKDILIFYEKLQEKFYHLLPFFTFIKENEETLEQTEDFNKVKEFKTGLYPTLQNENVFDILKKQDILEEIQEYFKLFENIYSGVRRYLDSIRTKFPRFYFLSNEELIEILSNIILDEKIIQKYMKKSIEGITELIIRNKNIIGIKSRYNEEIYLKNYVTIDRKLVNVFIETEEALHKKMMQEVSTATKSDLNDEKILSDSLGQVLFIALQIFCTFLSHQVINGHKNNLKDISSMVENYTQWIRKNKEQNSKRNVLKSIIISLIQQEDFLMRISTEKIKENDFIWLTRLKYYLENDICILRVLNLSFTYGYEFYSDFSPGICTPYTERCNISLISAYSRYKYGAIQGEACSGKTETFKNLAVALGVHYKIISCSDFLTFKILQRLLLGCSKGNMWLCLDEMNKIDFSVLSSMSDLLRDFNRLKIVEDDRRIRSFVCMTLSPTFPSLSKLPMTFKSQFRSICMIQMDLCMLSELTLTALGFKSAKYLSKCIDCLFKTLTDVLTKKSYKFSLKLLRKILETCDGSFDLPPDEEKGIFVKTVEETIQPMLSLDDTVIFKEIIDSVFEKSNVYETKQGDLRVKLVSHLENNHLHPEPSYVDRILQVEEALTSKQNVILLGDIFAGKTKATSALYNLKTGGRGTLEIINPTIFETQELYGFMDHKYDLWKEGILTKIFKKFSIVDDCWLLFDGPIQSYWIETLYSVLDDKRTFTLGSGDFLTIKDSNSILFEVAELDEASPSLISRCSVVFFETSQQPWLTLVKPWIRKMYNSWPDTVQNLLEDLMFWLFPPLLKFLNEHCTQAYNLGEFYLVKRTVNYVQILLNEALARKDEDLKNVIIWVQASVLLGIYIGLTATLSSESSMKFDVFFKQLSKNQVPEYPLPETIEKIDVNVPTEGLFSEYFYIYKGRGTFKYTPDTLKNEKVMFKTYIDDVMVPTTDTQRTLSILDKHISNNFPVILTGPTGTAKTLCIKHFVNHVLERSKYTSIFLKFIPRLTSKRLQNGIQSNFLKNISFDCEKEVRKNLIVIEDLNVVTLNRYKVSTVVEFLRQTLDYQFWYDTDSFEKIPMENLGFVATTGPQGGLYRNISKRLLKYFDIYKVNDVSDENLTRIFSNILQVEWRKNGFAADIALVTNSLANATLSVYEFCLDNFKTSPLKFSYSYNVWDFLKVLRGLFSLKKESADANKKIFNKLWMNECARVFGDRLLKLEERNKLYKELMIIYELQFKECFSETFNGIKYQEIPDKINFGTITCNGERYEEMDYENLKERLEEFSRKYHLSTGIKLVLFKEVYPKIITISRLLSIENSHGLLLGVSGTGRKTLIDLASIVHNCKVFNPHISYLYDEKTWHNTFKQVLIHSGGGGKTTAMYLNEEHLIHQFILQDFNSFLQNGDIMDLFEIEEEPLVLNMVRLDAQCGNPNLNISSHDVYTFFIERCRRKLHIFFSLNCEPSTIEMRTQLFPSLVKYCTPIWFNEWSDEALCDIAYRWTENQTCETSVKFFNDAKLATGQVFKMTGKKFHVTTKTYVEFLQLYSDVIEKEKSCLKEIKENYLTGLRKLKYADNQIKKLQEHLCAYQLQLRIMSKKAGDMTRQIARETLDVERASDLVKKDEKVANVQAEAAAILKADCEIDLAQAIPILEDAIQALNTLKPPDITLVKSMKNPPDAIKLVMAAVCVIKDVKPDRIPDPSTGRKLIDYWGPSKRILGDMNFLQSLKDFDKDHIKPEIMVKIRKDYLSHKDFKPHVVAKASSAAEGLCKWIIAMDMYDKVAKEVAPKKEKLEKAEREYAETLAILDEKKLEVVRLERQLAQLNVKLQEANKKQSRLQKTADACNRKLERSVILVTGFEDEKIQWSNEVAKLDLKHRCLGCDVLLTSAFIAYLSPFPTQFRRDMVEKWYKHLRESNVPVSEDWDLTTTLISNNVVLRGLPQEKYFYENSIVHKYSQKYSLIIDPHGLAKNWIQKTVDKATLHITKYGYSNFIQDVKHCLKSGKILLVENVSENISSCLNTILNKELTKEGHEYFITFKGEDIKFNKNFQLIMLTTLTSPNYKTEITNKLRIIDFTITNFSIQTKLLSLVIKTEDPLVSKQISISKKKQKKNENLLKEYEENILKTLSAAEADLLEDNRTLRILDDTKNMYKRINQEIYLPDKVVPTFQRLEEDYREFSHYASTIFFCVEDFLGQNEKNKFPYKQFLTVFRKSILDAPLSKDPTKRIENIKGCFTYTISRHVGRIVSPKQYLSFLYHMTCKILIFNAQISQEEFKYLSEIKYSKQKSLPNKILQDLNRTTEKTKNWDQMKHLQNLKAFQGFVDSAKDNQTLWDKFLSENDPEDQQIPHPWQNNLNDFQKFLLLQTLRPDRTEECMKKLVTQVLDEKYVRPVEIDLEKLYSESFCLSPILFLTSNDRSPIAKLRNFAVKKKFSNKFRSVCISEGDNTRVEEVIAIGQSEGLWVCLLNCHLSRTWRYNLEKICGLMTFENTNENFRLWLISDVSFDLPCDLLEKCVKTVYEDTEFFKDNLLNSYKDFVDDVNVEEYQNYSQVTVRLIYRMVCFHTVINWRSRFEGIAWNNPFTFEDYNLRFALKFLPSIISIYKSNKALDYLIGQASYCGQIMNKIDYEVADTLFKEFMSLGEISIFTFPNKNNIHDFIEHIVDRIPSRESPECFGFNQACLLRKNIRESLKFTLYIPSMDQTWDDGHHGEELKKIIETSYKLINVEIKIETEIKTEQNTLETILNREIEHCLKLSNHILKYLKILDVILTNNSLLSTELKEIVRELLMNKIPKKFLKYSFVTDLNYSLFIINLRQRLLFFKEWKENGVPESIWISAFFFPSAVLTVQKMLYVQKLGQYLNTFSNMFEMVGCEADDGIKIHGLFLVNARFDLAESYIELLPSNVYFEEITSISIKPLLDSDRCCYNCPVYRTDRRRDSERFRNLIFFIGVRSKVPKNTLAKLGVALVCEKPNE